MTSVILPLMGTLATMVVACLAILLLLLVAAVEASRHGFAEGFFPGSWVFFFGFDLEVSYLVAFEYPARHGPVFLSLADYPARHLLQPDLFVSHRHTFLFCCLYYVIGWLGVLAKLYPSFRPWSLIFGPSS